MIGLVNRSLHARKKTRAIVLQNKLADTSFIGGQFVFFSAQWLVLTICALSPLKVNSAAPESVLAIAGNYVGHAYNGANLDPVTTVMAFDDNGRFMGRYKVDDESRPFEGTLSGLIQEGERAFSMEWTDMDGEGFVYMEFNKDYSAFVGSWTTTDGDEQFPWNGRRQ